jgi:hypothetical protein
VSIDLEIKGGAFQVGMPKMEEVAEAAAVAVVASVNAQPGGRWNRTGHLLASIRAVKTGADEAGVEHASDRLQHADLAERFAAEVLTFEPLDEPAVRAAIESVVDEMIGE